MSQNKPIDNIKRLHLKYAKAKYANSDKNCIMHNMNVVRKRLTRDQFIFTAKTVERTNQTKGFANTKK